MEKCETKLGNQETKLKHLVNQNGRGLYKIQVKKSKNYKNEQSARKVSIRYFEQSLILMNVYLLELVPLTLILKYKLAFGV